MGNTDTKLNFRKAVVQLTTKTQPVEAADEAFWNQFWSESVTCVQDIFTLIPAQEIRALREENPSNLATLCYKSVEKLVTAGETGCRSVREQQTVLNCIRLLTRILPYIFEDPDWRGFFWSTLPRQNADQDEDSENPPLAQSLINALCDLLFCPEFTVQPNRKTGPDVPEDMSTIDSCEYIWEAGVGFANSPTHNQQYDSHRWEILKLLLTCFSETMYMPPVADAQSNPNQWISYITSTENRHALPLFTSLLNVVCAYDPIGYGVPYNHLMFNDSREPLIEVSLQVLCVTLDNDPTVTLSVDGTAGGTAMEPGPDMAGSDNLFVNYMSRIHREEDFGFILKGITRLLNNPLIQTYLPGSCKRIQFHQELLVLFWKMCDINKKFMFYVLKSSDVLDVLVPILYFLNDARADQSRVGLMHIGVFILLLLSGERNFGVRLNKPYTVRVPMDIPVFTGTHADFLIIVFHKIITTGHQRLQPLFDCLLTIIVNVSPYLKTLSMVSSTKMLHLLEAFSTPWFLYASPTNHHLVFFLLEVFNNIIQYQFDGNANLVYTIIRKRNVFHQLANLPTDHSSIAKALTKRSKGKLGQLSPLAPPPGAGVDHSHEQPMEGSQPAQEAEPGTLKVSLAATPAFLSYFTLHVRKTPAHNGSGGTDLNPSSGPGGGYMFSIHHNDLEMSQCGGQMKVVNVPEMVGAESMDHSQYLMESYNQYLESEMSSPKLRSAFSNIKQNASSSSLDDGETSKTFMNSGNINNRMLFMDQMNIPVAKLQRSVSVDSLMITDTAEDCSCGKLHCDKCYSEPAKPLILDLARQSTQETSDVKARLAQMLGIDHMTEKSPASVAHIEQQVIQAVGGAEVQSIQPSGDSSPVHIGGKRSPTEGDGMSGGEDEDIPVAATSTVAAAATEGGKQLVKQDSEGSTPRSPAHSTSSEHQRAPLRKAHSLSSSGGWVATPEWVSSWKQKLPLQTIMRLLQVLVPQVEKICIDKGLTDESEILKFLQHGTLVGLLPVPHPILIRKYQANSGTTMWFRTYMWGVIYLRNVDPPVWYDTDVKLFEIQRV